ncbi:hypothetical protein BUALT_BualtUnG0001900 [Buddleja alternifolia]|uniref:HSF-type DNA-binding domain-containing protein n=1 Tax=Buddleja alternifolia TaxID=168488 RepID=A0AAV6W3W5_9LAMI|nr:hypothetical protein BUALT_BualtUnG0001900 [Buddleja alternifolia]
MALKMVDKCESVILSLDSEKSVVPAPFLTKTYELVDDPSTDHIVSWGQDDATFVVWRPSEFARHLLPNYFKHNNFSSFIRQLNTYGFRKIVADRWEFANEFFKKGEKHLLCEVHRRKIAQPQVALNHRHRHPITGKGFFSYPARVSISPSCDGADEFQPNINNWCDYSSVLPPLSFTALSEDKERLRRNNHMLVSEIAHMRKLYNDIIYFVQNNEPSQPASPINGHKHMAESPKKGDGFLTSLCVNSSSSSSLSKINSHSSSTIKFLKKEKQLKIKLNCLVCHCHYSCLTRRKGCIQSVILLPWR